MEGTLMKVFPLGGALLICAATFWLWWVAWGRPKSIERELRRQGIPGTTYGLFNTDLREEAVALTTALSKPIPLSHGVHRRVFPFIQLMSEKYGKMGFTWKGATPRLMVRDPDLVKEIFCIKDGSVQKPPQNPFVDLINTGVAAMEGEKWVKRRKLIMSAFHIDKLKGNISPVFLTSSEQLIQRWEKLLAIDGKGFLELDVWPELRRLTGDVITRTAFGSCYEEGKRVFQLQEELAFLALEACSEVYIPGISWILPTRRNRKIRYLDNEIKSILREQIRRKRLATDQDGTSGKDDDLLSLLLRAVSDGEGGDVSEEDVMDECRLFYFAGHETTAVTLTWALVVLSVHQDWQQKARDEVLKIFGRSPPDPQKLSHLKTVSMVLNEVQRLYPPASCLYRHIRRRVALAGGLVAIPAGVDIVAPAIFMHHDPDIWGTDADEFNPERFSDGTSRANGKDQGAFFPFGWGPRICLGQSFYIMEAKIALSMILQRFSLELSPSYAHAPCFVVTLQPQHGAQIILRARTLDLKETNESD